MAAAHDSDGRHRQSAWHPVIAGFINAAAIMIILSQLTAFTGIPAVDGSPLAQARHLIADSPPSIRSRCRSAASVRAAVGRAALWLLPRAAVPASRRPPSSRYPHRADAVAIVAVGVVVGFGLDQRFGVATVGTSRRSADMDMAVVRHRVVARRDAGVRDDRARRRRAELLDRHAAGPAQKATHQLEPGVHRARRCEHRRAFTGGMPIAGSLSRVNRRRAHAITGVFSVLFVVVTLLWFTPVFRAAAACRTRGDHHHFGVGLHRLRADIPILEVLPARQHHARRRAARRAGVRRRTRSAGWHAGRGCAVRPPLEPSAHRRRRPHRRFGAFPQPASTT